MVRRVLSFGIVVAFGVGDGQSATIVKVGPVLGCDWFPGGVAAAPLHDDSVFARLEALRAAQAALESAPLFWPDLAESPDSVPASLRVLVLLWSRWEGGGGVPASSAVVGVYSLTEGVCVRSRPTGLARPPW